MERRITDDQILDIAKSVLEFVGKQTSDYSTAKKILGAATAALGGGFSEALGVRLSKRQLLDESTSSRLESLAAS
jgi:hypothetical protein